MAKNSAKRNRKRQRFKQYAAIVFEPTWWIDPANAKYHQQHPLKYGEVVYYLGEIPNVQGHCIVVQYDGRAVPMVHPEDFRKAREDEL